MSAGDIFTALGVVVAALGALLAGYFSRRSLLYASQSEKSAKEANAQALHANVLSANSWLDQYMTNVRLWADEGCDAISIAIHALKSEESKQDELLLGSLHKISALIDRGRWFFPNLWSDEYGQHKEPAYRGLRQPILDCLVGAHNTIQELINTKDQNQISELLRFQRMFVSEVQQVLNPRRRELEIKRIIDQFAISEKLRAINAPEA